jgi:hypothetical protein
MGSPVSRARRIIFSFSSVRRRTFSNHPLGFYLSALSKSRQRKKFLKIFSSCFSGIFEKKIFGIGDALGELPL